MNSLTHKWNLDGSIKRKPLKIKTRPAPTDCRYEPPYPKHKTVVFAEHGLSDVIVHAPSSRCKLGSPHKMDECGEFEPAKEGKHES